METLIQTYGDKGNLSASFRDYKGVGAERHLQGTSLHFELHYDVEERDTGRNLQFIPQLLEENFHGRVFADPQDPQIDWFRMGEKLGTLKLTVIPKLSYPTIAMEVYQLISSALNQSNLGVYLREVRVFHNGQVVSYARKENV